VLPAIDLPVLTVIGTRINVAYHDVVVVEAPVIDEMMMLSNS
jgi:hypothetical protein